MDKDLKDLREKINVINDSILELLNRRTELIKEIVELKDETDSEYFDPEREIEMMERILSRNDGPLYMNL